MTLNKNFSILILAAALGISLGACRQAPAPETAGNYVDDTTITAKVKSTLLSDNLMKSLQVSVTTTHGVVQLSGLVDTADQRSAAVKDAAAVAGVKDVTNNIRVK